LPKAMGAALGVSLAQKIGVKSPYPDDAIIFCNFGDASANHSTATGAINTACWCWHRRTPMQVLFLCEDNGIGISVSTPTHWIRSAYAHRPELHYLSCDGLDLIDTYRCAQQAVKICRDDRRPVFAHMKTVRLLGHAGSDVESVYRNRARIE